MAAPPEIQDADGDRIADDRDTCPRERGVAPNGCAVRDSDGDRFLDHLDACPFDPGVKPDGCPLPDKDRDRIADADDQCLDVPETWNTILDTDGCPDELPADLAAVTGTLHGVRFDPDMNDFIRPDSRPALDRLVKVLAKYPSIRVEISGHSDSSGMIQRSRPTLRQANAVKTYLVRHGIAEDRLETRGPGPDEPVDTNKTAAGRAKNRRIEITILVP